ncbi:MAG: Asp-tRNA(Asn)/Glu-tRNA(Gln) amidotransferase subunit GatA [Pseudomonadota bacterium]
MSLTDLTIADALTKLKAKEISAVELTQAHLDACAAHRDLNALITETPDLALKAAQEADKRYAAGQPMPLDGIPIAVKDLFCTKDVRTTAASRILDNFIPPYSSTVTKKLESSGTIMVGKANLDEFAMGGSNTTSAFGPVINPWQRDGKPDIKLVPGGSSGGSAAAVAARMAMGATGTDTGGSTRQPGSFCGIVGVKPTYGRCSRFGIIAFSSSLDQAGCFTRTVTDGALMLEAMSGHDPQDSTSAARDVPQWARNLNANVKGLRVGIPREYRVDGMPAEIEKIWEQGIAWLKAAGAEIVDITLPHTQYAVATYYIIAPAEASSNLARYDGMRYGVRVEGENLVKTYEKTRAKGFGDEVTRRIMIGTYALSSGYYDAYYIKAQKVRRLIANDFTAAFQHCDVILAPTAPESAFAIGENADDPVKMYLCDVFTIPASLAGLPAMSVPAGLDSQGLPLGLQVIAKAWDEQTMFNVAKAIEDAAALDVLPHLLRKAA